MVSLQTAYTVCYAIIALFSIIIILQILYLAIPKQSLQSNYKLSPKKKRKTQEEEFFSNYELNTENLDQSIRVITTIEKRVKKFSARKNLRKISQHLSNKNQQKYLPVSTRHHNLPVFKNKFGGNFDQGKCNLPCEKCLEFKRRQEIYYNPELLNPGEVKVIIKSKSDKVKDKEIFKSKGQSNNRSAIAKSRSETLSSTFLSRQWSQKSTESNLTNVTRNSNLVNLSLNNGQNQWVNPMKRVPTFTRSLDLNTIVEKNSNSPFTSPDSNLLDLENCKILEVKPRKILQPKLDLTLLDELSSDEIVTTNFQSKSSTFDNPPIPKTRNFSEKSGLDVKSMVNKADYKRYSLNSIFKNYSYSV